MGWIEQSYRTSCRSDKGIVKKLTIPGKIGSNLGPHFSNETTWSRLLACQSIHKPTEKDIFSEKTWQKLISRTWLEELPAYVVTPSETTRWENGKSLLMTNPSFIRKIQNFLNTTPFGRPCDWFMNQIIWFDWRFSDPKKIALAMVM